MEKIIEIAGKDVSLEAFLNYSSGEKAVVVTHPHSLYGGDMHNPVVQVISAIYSERGYTTLRFNFRGVGNSTGTFDNGKGEQLDLESAIQYLEASGIRQIDLAGYSFGSWVIYNTAGRAEISNRIILVSPPVDFIDFVGNYQLKNLYAVIVGTRDEFASLPHVQKQMTEWGVAGRLKTIEGGDHFYTGCLDDLKQILTQLVLE